MTGLSPDITTVTAVEHGVPRPTLADGLSAELGVPDLKQEAVSAQARPPEGLATVAVDADTGTVVWPAVLAPGLLYVRARPCDWTDQDAAA